MLLSENFRIAIRAILANKMRSALTMLGIAIGVAAVVALLGIGNGATASITSEVSAMGTNVITIRPGTSTGFGPNASGGGTQAYLYLGDYERLVKSLDGLAGITPEYQSSFDVVFGSDGYTIPVSGVTEDYLTVNAYTIAEGRALKDTDDRFQSRVAVLGAQAAEDLFGKVNPIGKTIKIDGINFSVVGVLKEKGSSGIQNPDNIILIPIETGYAKLFGASAMKDGNKIVNTILLSTFDAEEVDGVIARAEYLLRREHGLKPEEESDFNVQSQSDSLETLSSVTQTLTIFLGAIAAISLLVGGIGIMNIMLVSVTERTKEIGLRKAVGADRNQILTQFLIETLVVSLLGGAVGVLLGVGIALLVNFTGVMAAQITTDSIVMAFGFSLAIGVFFGIYPAYRAANLHPIEALRYE